MPNKDSVQIAPAEGKLGVLIPGMGAVTTTFIAGLEAFKLGLGKPIGSLTQLGTVRLGKRTEGRSPAIKDFVPLANMSDIEVGCWDIFEDNAYEAAMKAGVLETALLEQVKAPLSAIQPMKAVFDQNFVKRINGPNIKAEGFQDGPCRDGDGRHPAVPEADRRGAHHDDLVRLHRGVSRACRGPRHAEGFRVRAAEERSGDLAQPDLRLRGAEIGRGVRQRRAASDHRHAGAAGTGAQYESADLRARTSRAARRS